MRKSYALRILLMKDPATNKRELFNIKLFGEFYGTPVWKMIIKDTIYDITH